MTEIIIKTNFLKSYPNTLVSSSEDSEELKN